MNPVNRLPKWAVVTIGIVLFLFALLGITNSEHAAAKVVYAALIVVSLALVTLGLRRPATAEEHREAAHPQR